MSQIDDLEQVKPTPQTSEDIDAAANVQSGDVISLAAALITFGGLIACAASVDAPSPIREALGVSGLGLMAAGLTLAAIAIRY